MKAYKTILYTAIMILVSAAIASAGPIKDVHIRDTDDDRMAVNENGSINVNTVATVASITEIASGTFRICNAAYTVCLDIDNDGSMPMNDNNGSLTVDATQFDTRPLTAASDTVTIVGSSATDTAIITDRTSGAEATIATGTHSALRVEIGDGYDLANVDATGHLFVADGSQALSVDDNEGSLTVDSVQLDTRPLTAASDAVKISDGTETALVNTHGAIYVQLTGSSGLAFTPPMDSGGLTTKAQIWKNYPDAMARNNTQDSGEIVYASATVTANWTYATGTITNISSSEYSFTDVWAWTNTDLGGTASASVPVQILIIDTSRDDDIVFKGSCDIMSDCQWRFSTPIHIYGASTFEYSIRMSSRAGASADLGFAMNGYKGGL